MAKELKLDTSDLQNYRSLDQRLLPPEYYAGKDNFGGKYYELLKSIGLGSSSVKSSFAHLSGRDLAGEYVKDVNSAFDKRRASICLGLHEYLVAHKGKVGCWPQSKEWTSSYSLESDPSKTSYVFDYFGTDYIVKDDAEKGFAVSQKQADFLMEYKNHYKYPKQEPLEPAELSEMKEEREKIFCGEIKAAKEAVGEVETALSQEEAHSRVRGFFGLLFSLIWVLIWAMPCIHPMHPIDYAAMDGWVPAINDWIHGLAVPEWVSGILVLLGYIPILLVYFFTGVEKVLFPFMEWMVSMGVGWYVGGILVCVVLCLIGLGFINVYLPAWDLVRPSKKGAIKKQLSEAKRALRDVKREQSRKQDEYIQQDRYKRLLAKHQANIKAYESDKAMNEAFAELWQRAWYDFIISAQ